MIKRILIILPLFLLLQSISYAQSLSFFTKKYVRTENQPNLYTDTIPACNTGATYSLVVINGENGEDVISSASITLNGIEIVRENEFNQRVERIEKTITLQAENTLNIRLASGPGGFITINVFCSANCLSIDITRPEDLSTINKSKVIVKGALFNVYGETGVTITNGGVSALSQVHGAEFSGIVPLQTGTNIITATTTDACGLKAKDTVTVNTELTEEPIRLTAAPSSGVVSAAGTFEVTFEAEATIETPVANYSWDFDGDGTPESAGSDLAGITYIYRQAGLYLPAVTVTDAQNNAYTETTVVNVLSREEMDALLKGKWEGMKGELAGGDVAGALKHFTGSSAEKYREGFEVLRSQFSTIFGGSEELVFISVEDNVASYENIVLEDDGKTYSYPVTFILDEDGIWRIKDF